jgi:hypothetical protein
MDSHFCSACGQEHGSGGSPEVEIARINAKRDVEVARIQRGETKHAIETEAETEVAVAELEAVAQIEVAAELAGAGAPAAEEPETQASVVEGPPADPAAAEPTIEPAESSMPEPKEPKANRGYWP